MLSTDTYNIERYKRASKQLHALSKKWTLGGIWRMVSDASGICYLVKDDLDTYECRYLMETWEKRDTDNPLFPVPHPWMIALHAYSEGSRWVGEYGDNRRELAKHMADTLDEIIRTGGSL